MKSIYKIQKSPVGYADHQNYIKVYFECESNEEYEQLKAKHNTTDGKVCAREYYDAHCWQGQRFDAVGFEVQTDNDYLLNRWHVYMKPGSITNRKEVQIIDNWWEGS